MITDLTNEELRAKFAKFIGITDYRRFKYYPEDHNAAIQLCDRLKEEGWNISIHALRGIDAWQVNFSKGGVVITAEDKFLPRAITIAFLKAKGELR